MYTLSVGGSGSGKNCQFYLYSLVNKEQILSLKDLSHNKVNVYTFRGAPGEAGGEEQTCYFVSGIQLLKEIICFSRSKFFPLRIDLFWKV